VYRQGGERTSAEYAIVVPIFPELEEGMHSHLPSTLRLRNIHDRIGGKSEREELINAKASDSGHPE
jgi:hypothetical protein